MTKEKTFRIGQVKEVVTSKPLAVFAIVCMVIGFACWMVQLIGGFSFTGMSNGFTWGLYIASFAFFVGCGAGSMMFACLGIIAPKSPFSSFVKLGIALACAFMIAAGITIMMDLGELQNIFHMIIHANIASPLFWDMCVIAGSVVFAFFLLYVVMLPQWHQSVSVLATPFLGWEEERVAYASQVWSRRIACVALPFAVLTLVVEALVFATQQARHWWHSAILPFDFVLVSLASGAACLLIAYVLLSGLRGLDEKKHTTKRLAYGIVAAVFLHLFCMVLEVVLLVWSGSAEANELLSVIFGTYGVLYGAEIVLPLIAIAILLSKKAFGKPKRMIGASVLVLLAAFAHRLMLLYPAFYMAPYSVQIAQTNDLWIYPMASGIESGETFVSSFAYVPSLIECGGLLLPIGVACIALLLIYHCCSLKKRHS